MNPVEQATSAHLAGAYADAADQYAAAGFEVIGSSISQSSYDGPKMSRGLCHLFRSGVCHKLSDQTTLYRLRCRQGAELAKEIVTRVQTVEPPENAYDRAHRGVWYEFLGDFRQLGGFEAPDDAYNHAVDIYVEADDPDTGYSEWGHMRLMELFDQIAAGAGHNEQDWPTFNNDETLTDWVTHKQQQLPVYLDEIIQAGQWEREDTCARNE